MKILNTQDYIKEKYQIKPLTKERLKNISIRESVLEKFSGKKLRLPWDIVVLAQRNNIPNFNNISERDFMVSYAETRGRFLDWLESGLTYEQLLKKHEQRARKKMKYDKKLACFAASLFLYGNVVANTWYGTSRYRTEDNNILEYYYDMLIREGFTDELIYKVFVDDKI